MRHIALVLILAVLSGCPGQSRIYVHNKGEVILTYLYSWHGPKPVIVKPGRTKHFVLSFTQNTCFNIEVGSEHRSYQLPEEPWKYFESKGYGGRLDAFFEYGKFFVQAESTEWIELTRVVSCNDA